MMKGSVIVIRSTVLAKFSITTCSLNVQLLTTNITSSPLIIAVIVPVFTGYCQASFEEKSRESIAAFLFIHLSLLHASFLVYS